MLSCDLGSPKNHRAVQNHAVNSPQGSWEKWGLGQITQNLCWWHSKKRRGHSFACVNCRRGCGKAKSSWVTVRRGEAGCLSCRRSGQWTRGAVWAPRGLCSAGCGFLHRPGVSRGQKSAQAHAGFTLCSNCPSYELRWNKFVFSKQVIAELTVPFLFVFPLVWRLTLLFNLQTGAVLPEEHFYLYI